MGARRRFGARDSMALVLLAALAAGPPWPGGATAAAEPSCHQLVDEYLAERTQDLDVPHDPNKFLFFLHVPRTAGKTYFSCFVKPAYPPSKRCAMSYDVLRLNVSSEACTLLVSHDDFSISERLLPGAAVITQLRRPVERLISSYEFAVDVAARRVHVNESAVARPQGSDDHFISTLEVWPWSHLIQFFRVDMQQRMEAMKEDVMASNQAAEWQEFNTDENRSYWWSAAQNRSVWELPPPDPALDPYDNPLVMPLREWIEHPIAHELIHNGQTAQVLGLTNLSYWPEAKRLRVCMLADPAAAMRLSDVALQRLRALHHVGLTERLDESVLSLAASLGLRLNSSTYRYTSSYTFSYDGGSLPPDQLVTYNASYNASALTTSAPPGSGGGGNASDSRLVTVTVAAARARLLELSRELWSLEQQLHVHAPKLQELVDQEAAWLDEQDARAAAEGRAPPPPPPPGGEDRIDSPWAAQIEALDEKVADMQDAMERSRAELESLRAVAVVRVDEATGRATQLVPDSHFEHRESLGAAYRRCEKSGHERTAKKPKESGFRHLRTPASHQTFAFSPAARRALDPAVRVRIAELNSLDERLYDEGAALLAARSGAQRRARRLESFVNYDVTLAAPPAGGGAKAGGGVREGGRGGDARREGRAAARLMGGKEEKGDPTTHDEL